MTVTRANLRRVIRSPRDLFRRTIMRICVTFFFNAFNRRRRKVNCLSHLWNLLKRVNNVIPSSICVGSVSIMDNVRIVVADPILSKGKVATALTRRRIRRAPNEVVPRVLVSVRERNNSVPCLGSMATLYLRIQRICYLRLSRTNLFLAGKANVGGNLHDNVLRLRLSTILFRVSGNTFKTLCAVANDERSSTVLYERPTFRNFQILRLLGFRNVCVRTGRITRDAFFTRRFSNG